MARKVADFPSLTSMFGSLTYSRKDKDRFLAIKILDDLNNLDFEANIVNNPTVLIVCLVENYL